MDFSPNSRLSALQQALLRAFAIHAPEWFLTGGGALSGFHYKHRTTEDLDLFATPERSSEEGEIALRAAAAEIGATIEPLIRTPDFKRFAVKLAEHMTLADLVIDRAPQVVIDKPRIDGVRIDPVREIAVNKLSALMGRNEPRDLVDLREILARGASLETILKDASLKDGSLEPAALSWVLASAPPIVAAAVPEGYAPAELEQFRDELIKRLREIAIPRE